MDITQELLETDATLQLHNEGDWDHPYNPNVKGYASFNDAGIEVETGEFLYSIARVLKPMQVLETGTHFGVGMSYLASALRENGFGHLTTLEFLPEIHERAMKRVDTLHLTEWVTGILGDATKFEPGDKKYKLILLDTEPQTRFAEMIKFFPFLEEGGFLFIHDLHQHMHQVPNEEHGFAWPYGILPEQIKGWVKSGQLRPFHFETPRGLTGFYKVHPNDYHWFNYDNR